MQLQFIDIGKLSVSPANMRAGRKAPDISDILPSVRARGVLVPLLVRPNARPEPDEGDNTDSYEIVAGRRRYHAALALAGEEGTDDPEASRLPCAILDEADDASAIEASLIENLARLDPDEVSQWEAFTRLVKEGRSVEEIGITFGLPELGVRRVLALGNLLPRIRDLYRREEIDASTVRHLTLASKSQQKAWLALHDDPEAYVPTGHQLKAWLFGGASISTSHALFDLASYPGEIVADLFGEGGYFADAERFWTAQYQAIEERRTAYLDAGWSDVVIVPCAEHFHVWEYEKAQKRKGGRVYIDVRANGEVSFHEGYVSRTEARRAERLARGEQGAAKPARPEVTSSLQAYIDLHRHAAVRADLVRHPMVALRLMVAHVIAGSPLWTVRVEPQTCRNESVTESVESSAAEAAFDEARRAVLARLGFSPEAPTVTGGSDAAEDHDASTDWLSAIFLRLIDLPDVAVMEVVTIVMGETLAAGSAIVEALALRIGVDMTRYWQADDAFFMAVRDREVLGRIVAEVAGESVARANAGEKIATLKTIIRDHLDGTNGRAKVEPWVPRWMAFPPSAYTARGGVGTVNAHARIMALLAPEPTPGPDSPPNAAAMIAPDEPDSAGPQSLAA